MNVVLISTYELGRQPFGLASPAAWLKHAGASVACYDLSIDHLDEAAVRSADLVAIYVPMHTASRLAIPIAQRVKRVNPRAHLCFYGLYAPMNEKFLFDVGADSIIGGEFENQLVALYRNLVSGAPSHTLPACSEEFASSRPATTVSLERQNFLTPDRSGLPDPSKYARLVWDYDPRSSKTLSEAKGVAERGGAARVTGYTEASRGCKHLCRHCPIVPVYGGQFRVVQKEIVLADIRQQVGQGARHITFGDPDFFNGPTHALAIVKELHQEFPEVTYDVTIKIEHLLQRADALPTLRDTGCAFVTSAVEAVDNGILQVFDKHHTREDFIRVAEIFRDLGMVLQPTFVAFNPWISLEGYRDLLALIAELDLIDHVPPIQYAIRLLVPSGSRLLELADTREWLGSFDAERLCYAWTHRDARVDELQKNVLGIVQAGGARHLRRREIFEQVWKAASFRLPESERVAHHCDTSERDNATAVIHRDDARRVRVDALASKPIPHLSEPWYC